VTPGELFRIWLRPVAAVAGLIGAIAAAINGQWPVFGLYLAVFLAFGTLSVLTLRDVRAARAKRLSG
jgi:hypothetical protein